MDKAVLAGAVVGYSVMLVSASLKYNDVSKEEKRIEDESFSGGQQCSKEGVVKKENWITDEKIKISYCPQL